MKKASFKNVPKLFAVIALFASGALVASSARAQGTQEDTRAQNDTTFHVDDTTRGEIAQFAQFLNSHREIAEQLRKDPSLSDNRNFVDDHAELKRFLDDHPAVREQLRQDPNAFMRLEESHDRREDRTRDTRADIAKFNRLLSSHPEVAEQLRRDPSLADNKEYLDSHPELNMFLQDHADVRDRLEANPAAFMREEVSVDRQENQGGRNDYRDLAEFNRFLENHPEIAEQLRKDPSLADNRMFLDNHPALKTYLQDNPGARGQLQSNPSAFMRQEDEFQFAQGGRDHNANMSGSFKEFLGSHSDISMDLSRNPALIKDHDYMQAHPELQSYVKVHPNAPDQFMKNPQDFTGTTRFNPNRDGGDRATDPVTPFDAKPKQ
jgi:hypothetical protein